MLITFLEKKRKINYHLLINCINIKYQDYSITKLMLMFLYISTINNIFNFLTFYIILFFKLYLTILEYIRIFKYNNLLIKIINICYKYIKVIIFIIIVINYCN